MGRIKLSSFIIRLGIKIKRYNFWQGPFSKDALIANDAKSHNFTNLFFCDVTLRYSMREKGIE